MASPPIGNDSSFEGLSFLVTHWLANFEAGADTTPSSSNADDAERMRAVERIRNAGADIASAFSSLGAFGTTIPPSFSASSWTQEIAPQNATYSDIRRRWNGVSPSHLEQMAHAVASTNAVVEASGAATQTNLLEAVRETGKKGSGTSAAAGGRTAQDAIAVEDRPTGNQETSTNLTSLSILQPPSLVASAQAPTRKVDFTNSEAERLGTPPSILQARSGYAEVGQSTAETMRKLLELREKVQSARHEMKGLDASIAKQASAVAALEEEYRLVSADGSDMTRMLEVIDEVKAGKQECERVTAQLQRKLVDLSSTLQTDESELGGLENEIRSLESRRKGIVRSSRDPCWSWPGKLAPGSWIGANPILQTIIGRQQGLSRPRNTTMFARSSIIHGPSDSHFVATRKALLASRLSHAATINTHIGYPVYCLRFDRTGTYFISGADDYLVKVFHLGSGQSSRNKNAQDGSRELRCNYGANLRGAVLVCSLRGHAGVINDIDVSSDNAFLATASVDGDVRVWGLKDGCPVAILRGHKGGANMVSWSKLTPYRLISTGCDGFARMWDIREACLKRYGAQVGKRAEYQLKLSDDEKEGLKNKSDSHNSSNDHSGTPLPVLPVREAPPPSPAGAAATSATTAIEANQIESAVGGVVVPPLPDAVPPLPVALAPNNVPNANPQNEIAPPGQFVANDAIDEGVKLLSKYKHGSTGEDVIGPGTRSRRAAVNVICVARCPLGMYFATGSDDGMCRVFEDDEDHGVATVDARANEEYSFSNTQAPALKTRATRSSDEPVLKLMGHISAITDLAYSNAGDKILSASQKDGVVRIWSLGKATFERSGESGVSQIVVNLTDPKSRAPSQPSRRTQGGAASISKVSCDVAVWTHDDTKIITSQSVLVKQSDSEIQPGSQYLFLWDSRTGQCLLGISGAHTMQCPVVVPHPTDSSLVFSAGADGIAKMWDWESGRCIFSHSNKVEYGPMEPSERNKLAGYLDGSFNPDGTMVVLTDDSGRLTIFDSNTVIASNGNAWMREQYFANDYYDLSYDNSGYCIEKGSERPPHLSPKGVRCDHTGSPWSDKISEAFSKLVGPSPLPEQISRWRRAEIRRKAASALESNNTVSERQALKVRRGIREFDPLSTIVIKGPGHLEETEIHSSKEHRTSNGPIHAGRRGTVDSLPTNSSPRNVSGNYRYLDYDDMMRREGNQDEDEPDSDDEEFSPAAPGRNRGAMENSDDDSDNDMDLDDDETEFVSRGNQRNRSRPVERRERAQRRANRHRDDQFVEIDSDDENVEQIMSTNNSPSGPFVEDYESHFWRMPTGNVRSKWLRRMESDTAYEGRKMYTPQLGDSVVYIARAHYETINLYPSLQPPWQSWPQGTAWPVVRCCVRGVRFRFPYEDYYRSSQSRGCKSLVAILTLEVTGIPELSENREFPWPNPHFIESTGAFVFELSMFENDQFDFLFPEGLYTERLTSLESALRDRNSMAGLPVSVYYDESSSEDQPMKASQCKIEAFEPEEDAISNPHMSGSGFSVVQVSGDSGGHWMEQFSPWDLCMADLSISRPHLADDEKALVSEKLNAQCRNDTVAKHFNVPVDTIRYCDYERMVEVAMDLMTVKGRLRADYYASKFSVIQDLRLIRDNCIKYNGAEHELVDIAKAMCEEFEAGVLTEEEASILKESDCLTLSRKDSVANRRVPTIRINLRQRTSRVSTHSHQRNQGSTNSRSDRLRRQSSLESLPAPEQQAGPGTRRGRAGNVQARASGRRTRSMDTNQVEPLNQRRSLRSRGSNLESLSRLNESQPDADEELDRTNNNARRRQGSRRTLRGGVTHSARSGTEDEADNTQNAPLLDAVGSRESRRAARSAASEHDEDSPRRAVPPRASNRSRATRSAAFEHDEVSPRQAVPPRASNRSARRSSRNVAQSEDDSSQDEEESDHESKGEEYDQESAASEHEDQSLSYESDVIPPTRTARRAAAIPTRSSPRMKRSAEADTPEESESRKSSRTRRTTVNASYEEPSDFEPEEDEPDVDSSEEEMSNSRNRSRNVRSYAELPSDFDDDDDFSDDEGKGRKTMQKRKREASPASKRGQAKKEKRPSRQQQGHLRPWPKVDLKSITSVCKSMTAMVEKEDCDEVFTIPVLESFPHLTASYLKLVEDPMDLRTIEEERIHLYMHIKDLQEDLKRMLENCWVFNGVEADLGQYAINIYNKLNEMFAEVCEAENVSLGRWRP